MLCFAGTRTDPGKCMFEGRKCTFEGRKCTYEGRKCNPTQPIRSGEEGDSVKVRNGHFM